MILKIKREKFKEITAIKINGQIINRVKCTKLLGLNVDDELSWKDHYKCLNSMVDFTFEFDHCFSFVQGRTRRANAAHCVKTNYARTSLFRDYFFNRIAIIWNGIPEDIKVATTLCSFKRQLKSFYFKRLYNVFDGDNVRSFKIICPKCRRVNILKACSC